MEYGSICFMGAATTHLNKLDLIQHAAEKIGNFKVESLQERREAAAIAFTCKLLDGKGRGVLKKFVPQIEYGNGNTRSSCGLQLKRRDVHGSLNCFKRSYLGNIHNIWLKIPKDIRELGMAKGWDKHKRIIKKSIGKKILNHWEKTGENNKQLSKLISKVQCSVNVDKKKVYNCARF